MTKNRIAMLRKMAGMEPVDVASRLGVTERTVIRWERSEVQIPDARKLKLADLFHVSVPFLMGWDNDESEKRAA